MDTNTPILLPAATQERLKALIQQRDQINQLIDTIIATARDLLNVPDDYQIGMIDRGFVPPKGG